MTNKCPQCKGKKLDKIWCPKCGNNKPIPLSEKSFKAEDIFKGIYPDNIELLEVKDVKQAIQKTQEGLKNEIYNMKVFKCINRTNEIDLRTIINEVFKKHFGSLVK
jgi:hypothetical protein